MCTHPTPSAVDRALSMAMAMSAGSGAPALIRRTQSVEVAPGATETIQHLATLPTVLVAVGVGLVQDAADSRSQVGLYATDDRSRRASLGQSRTYPASADTLGGTPYHPDPSPIAPVVLGANEAWTADVTNAGSAVATVYVTVLGFEVQPS